MRVSGGLITTYGVGAALGPLLGSMMMSVLGPAGLFVFTGWVGVGIAAYAVVRKRQAAAAPAEAKVAFQALPRTTPVGCELDPRAAPETPGESGGESAADNAERGDARPSAKERERWLTP